MTSTVWTHGEIKRKLDEIGCLKGDYIAERIGPVIDRLQLAPEGDDNADSLDEFHARCDREGVPPGTVGERIDWLTLQLSEARAERDAIRLELEAERSQLAAKAKPVTCDSLLADFTSLLIAKGNRGAREFLSLANVVVQIRDALLTGNRPA